MHNSKKYRIIYFRKVCSTTGRSYTYSQLRTACGRFASFLRKSKFHSGNTIALILPNVPEFGIVTLGAIEAGIKVSSLISRTNEQKKIFRYNVTDIIAIISYI